jgi:hypothetical protein
MNRLLAALLGLVVMLAIVAAAAPPPSDTSDRNIYEQMAAEIIVPGCDLLHCFRVLVPWTLGRIPGPSLLKWKAYAVTCNAAAAIAVFLLCGAWGFDRRAAQLAAAVSAFGFGSMYTLYDPFTSDPLMFLAGPLILWLLTVNRPARAALLAAVLIAAKEFAVVPVYIHAVAQGLAGRWSSALRTAALAAAVLAVWIALQYWLRSAHGYYFGATLSAQPLRGGYLVHWLRQTPPAVAAMAMAAELGMLWLLAPLGWRLAPAALRRAAIAALPAAAALAYFQQPDRALWNFHFIVTPLAALALARVPAVLAWTAVGLFAIADLRVGAQLPFVPAATVSLGVSLLWSAYCGARLIWHNREEALA